MRDVVVGSILARSAQSVLQIGCNVTKTKASKHISEIYKIQMLANSFFPSHTLSFFLSYFYSFYVLQPLGHSVLHHLVFSDIKLFLHSETALYNLKQQFQETNYPMFRYMYTTNNNIINNDNNNTINNIETQIFLSDVL